MSEYVATGEMQRGGRASVTARTTGVAFDGSPGQDPALPGPADLLTAAFAACLLKNVERYSRILPFVYERAEVTVAARRRESPPRIDRVRYRLMVVTDEPARRVELLHRNIRRFGTIYNTLAAVADVDGDIAAVPVDARRAARP